MITVEVKINQQLIHATSARRLEDLEGKHEEYTYLTSEGKTIKHKYSDGARKLAIKMLELKEEKQ